MWLKVFFAGHYKEEHKHQLLQKETGYRLLSFHYMTPKLSNLYFIERRSSYDTIIVDSGAYSVWNKGQRIVIDKYITFCLKYMSGIDYVVNLDVIPGKPGKKPSKAEGYNNYHYMLKKGIPKEQLIHVFHQGENFKWLEKMVREMEYIGLSPANDRSTKEKMEWLRQCMPYVCDSDGYPLIKFHGFGVTAPPVIRAIPFYSVDSRTWGCQASFRDIDVPWRYVLPQKETWHFSHSKPLINVGTLNKDSKSFFRKDASIQNDILAYLCDMGLTLDGVMNSMTERLLLNAVYINSVAEKLGPDRRYRPTIPDRERRKLRLRYNVRRHLVYQWTVPVDEWPDTWPTDWEKAQERARRVVAVPPVLP